MYKIPLSRATKLTYGCNDDDDDDDRHSQTTTTTKDSATLLNQLDNVMLHQQQQQQENSRSSRSDGEEEEMTNRFHLDFDSGEKIQFYCESIEELNKWISVLQVMICKLPKLPDWIIL